MTKRDQFWQAVRGVCIICVVLIHCKNGLGYQSSAEQGYFFDYWLVMRQLIAKYGSSGGADEILDLIIRR